MKAILWTLVVVGGLNTFGVIGMAFCGDRLSNAPTPLSRAIDALYTAGLAAWALWLLAGGAA
jgi:hypothetical protein